MKKIFPNSSIRKNIIGEIVGFDRDRKSDACELVSSLTGDNSREVVSFWNRSWIISRNRN